MIKKLNEILECIRSDKLRTKVIEYIPLIIPIKGNFISYESIYVNEDLNIDIISDINNFLLSCRIIRNKVFYGDNLIYEVTVTNESDLKFIIHNHSYCKFVACFHNYMRFYIEFHCDFTIYANHVWDSPDCIRSNSIFGISRLLSNTELVYYMTKYRCIDLYLFNTLTFDKSITLCVVVNNLLDIIPSHYVTLNGDFINSRYEYIYSIGIYTVDLIRRIDKDLLYVEYEKFNNRYGLIISGECYDLNSIFREGATLIRI